MNASAKCLLLCLCLMIQSCGVLPPKPTLEPKPPKIDCAERRETDPPPPPALGTDYRDWVASYVQALAWGSQAQDFRADTADCLDRHRKAGDIR